MSSKHEFFENYDTSEPLQFFTKFEDEGLGLKDEILNGIYNYGYEKPTPIQKLAIKPISSGRDIVIQSHSGSGKTATFLIGMLQRIDLELNETQCIIIANTHELAKQIRDVFIELSKYMKIRHNMCIGGDLQHRYMTNAMNHHVIIGTPGRLSDLLGKSMINSSYLKMIIIDEADDVLSSGFQKQVKKIFQQIPSTTQVVLVSATIPQEMCELFEFIMKPDYIKILVKDDELSLEGIKQFYVQLDDNMKIDTTLDLYKFIKIGQAIIYCNKKHRAEELSEALIKNKYSVSVLHGNLFPKERESIMSDFRTGKTRILITTDVLSRGIDIQQVSLVINYDMPKHTQTYIHRIGRSGRFGKKGCAINFVTRREQNLTRFIERTYNTKIDPLPSNVNDLI